MMNYDEFEQEFLMTFNVKKESLRTQKDLSNLKLKIKLFQALKRAECVCFSENEDDKQFMFFGLLSLIIMLISMFDNIFEQQQNKTSESNKPLNPLNRCTDGFSYCYARKINDRFKNFPYFGTHTFFEHIEKYPKNT